MSPACKYRGLIRLFFHLAYHEDRLGLPILHAIYRVDLLGDVVLPRRLDVRALRRPRALVPGGKDDVGDLGMEPQLAVSFALQTPGPVVGPPCLDACAQYRIIAIYGEEGPVKICCCAVVLVGSSIDDKVPDREIALRPSLIALCHVLGVINQIRGILLQKLIENDTVGHGAGWMASGTSYGK